MRQRRRRARHRRPYRWVLLGGEDVVVRDARADVMVRDVAVGRTARDENLDAASGEDPIHQWEDRGSERCGEV